VISPIIFAGQGPQCCLIRSTQLVDARHVTALNNQGMAFGNRECIEKTLS
jgi:hypothetical protein